MKKFARRKLLRHNFNMVEILLAAIVIAIGLAGTFVLFPIGLKTSKTAVAENHLADIAEYVTSFVRADVQVESIDPDSGGTADSRHKFDISKSKLNRTPKVITDGVATDDPGEDWDIPDTHKNRKSGSSESDESVAMILVHKNDPNVFLVRQLSGPEGSRFVEFSAIARVYLDKADGNSGFGEDYFPSIKPAGKSREQMQRKYSDLPTSGLQINHFLLPLVLELSWPADVPDAQREKRYFRFEIFNEQFEQKVS